MKKVLILSYFFPPCNLTASQRAYGWAKSLNKYGYYPVIITRSWDVAISSPMDAFKKSGKEVVIKKENGFEVHYLPYFPSLRDRLFTSSAKNIFFLFIQKSLTFIELVTCDITLLFIPYKNIYSYADDFLKANMDVKLLVVTANPFFMFKFGFLLNKKFNIKWVADYRDDWSTGELDPKKSKPILKKIIANIDKKNEKKWISSASIITSVSEYYVEKISTFTGVNGKVLLNGYMKEDFDSLHKAPSDCFTIVYNGTLYNTQAVEIILESFKQFVQNYEDAKIKLLFLGTAYDPVQEKRILNNAQQLDILRYTEVTQRKPRMEVLNIQKAAHVLLMIAYKGQKGVPSSKLYEYMAIGKPVVAFPADNDIIDNTLKPYNLGFVCNSKKQLLSTFETLFAMFKRGEYENLRADQNYVEQFSRDHQTQSLAEMLSQL